MPQETIMSEWGPHGRQVAADCLAGKHIIVGPFRKQGPFSNHGLGSGSLLTGY